MSKKKIKQLPELKKVVAVSKRKGEKVVFTNGCFDILHLGHIKYLAKAKSLGNKLVVAVNSDSSVHKIKGNRRPVIPEKERAALVAALACVDYVVIFAEAHPLKLLKALKPDVLVKGADWQRTKIVGADFVESYGGRVATVNFLKGYSSSSIIARIKEK